MITAVWLPPRSLACLPCMLNSGVVCGGLGFGSVHWSEARMRWGENGVQKYTSLISYLQRSTLYKRPSKLCVIPAEEIALLDSEILQRWDVLRPHQMPDLFVIRLQLSLNQDLARLPGTVILNLPTNVVATVLWFQGARLSPCLL